MTGEHDDEIWLQSLVDDLVTFPHDLDALLRLYCRMILCDVSCHKMPLPAIASGDALWAI